MRLTTILALVLGLLALPGVASAAYGDPCTSAAGAALKITDPAGGGATYATHELTVTAVGTDDDTLLISRSASAPGARRVGDPESSDPPVFVRDTPGPLTVTGTIETTDPTRPADDRACSATVSATVQLRPALPLIVSLKRPRKGRDGRGARIYEPRVPFTLVLKHRVGSDRRPLTVRARVTKRLRLPRKGAKAKTRTIAQRASDAVEEPSRPRCLLICPPRTSRGWAKGAEVLPFPIESGRVFSNGLRVRLVSPAGYPKLFGRRERIVRTPYGADIEVFQAGRRVARLRVVANCLGGGQSSKCRFRKISTKR